MFCATIGLWFHLISFLKTIPNFFFQGDPCEVCPTIPEGLANAVSIPGKPGAKGEPGPPGKPGKSVGISV